MKLRQTLLILSIALIPATLSAGETSKRAPAATGAAHYWYDGSEKRIVTEDLSAIVEFEPSGETSEALSSAGFAPDPAKGRIRIWTAPATAGRRALKVPVPEGVKASPAFRDAGGALRALPGGVIVKIRDGWNRKQIRDWAAAQSLTLKRELLLKNTWIVDAAPGLPSLELANRLHETGDVEWASPDWWKEVSKK